MLRKLLGYLVGNRFKRAALSESVLATDNVDLVVGEISWVLTDGPEHDVRTEGSKTVHLGEVAVQTLESRQSKQLVRKIELDCGFVVSLCVDLRSKEGRLAGFALSMTGTTEPMFGWDWFNVQGTDRAIKLQESGELSISIRQTKRGWDVVRTEFLTDVSLRSIRFKMPMEKEPTYRLLIREGSWMDWPTLTLDGQVAMPL